VVEVHICIDECSANAVLTQVREAAMVGARLHPSGSVLLAVRFQVQVREWHKCGGFRCCWMQVLRLEGVVDYGSNRRWWLEDDEGVATLVPAGSVDSLSRCRFHGARW